MSNSILSIEKTGVKSYFNKVITFVIAFSFFIGPVYGGDGAMRPVAAVEAKRPVSTSEQEADAFMRAGDFVKAMQSYSRAVIEYNQLLETGRVARWGGRKRQNELNRKLRVAISSWIRSIRPKRRVSGKDALELGRRIIEMIFSIRTNTSALFVLDPPHSSNTLDFVLILKPEASVPLRLAAAAHDIDRALMDVFVDTTKSRFRSAKKLVRHPQASADLICGLLDEANINRDIIMEVHRLIRRHEVGVYSFGRALEALGESDPNYDDLCVLTNADSLDFWNIGYDITFKVKGPGLFSEQTAAKFKRLSTPEARRLAVEIVKRERNGWDQINPRIYSLCIEAMRRVDPVAVDAVIPPPASAGYLSALLRPRAADEAGRDNSLDGVEIIGPCVIRGCNLPPGSRVDHSRIENVMTDGPCSFDYSWVLDSNLPSGSSMDHAYAAGIQPTDPKRPITIKYAVMEDVPPGETAEDWVYKPDSPDQPSIRTEGRTTFEGDNTVEDTLVRGSFLGLGAEVSGGTVEYSILGTGVRSDESKVYIVHAGDGSVLAGRAEYTEGITGDYFRGFEPAYVESVFSNTALLARVKEGGAIEWYAIDGIPNVSLIGAGSVFSVFLGTANPPENANGILTRIDPDREKQSSQHSRIVASPVAVVRPGTKIVGRPLGKPNISGSPAEVARDVLMNSDLTNLGLFSLVEGEVHAMVLPGGRSWGLGRNDRKPGWSFVYCPGLIIEMMRSIAETLPEGHKDNFDDLPARAIETGYAVCRAKLAEIRTQLATEQNPKQIEELRTRRREYIKAGLTYRALLRAQRLYGIWTFENGEAVRLREAVSGSGRYEVVDQPTSLAEIAQEAFSDRSYHQEIFGSLMTSRRAQVSAWRSPISRAELDEAATGFIAKGSRIDPTAKVVGCRLTGRARVGKRTVLFGVSGHNTTIGDDVHLIQGVIRGRKRRVVVENGVSLTRFRIENTNRRFKTRVGERTKGRHCVIQDSDIGPDNEINPFATLIRTRTDRGNIVGCRIADTNTAPGYINRHLMTEVENCDAPPIRFRARTEGRRRNMVVANAINVGGGSETGLIGPPSQRVTIQCAFVGSNAVIERGARIEFSFVLDAVASWERKIPFTFSWFRNIRDNIPKRLRKRLKKKVENTPGPWCDVIGGFLDRPGAIFRSVIYRTKFPMAPQDRWMADYLVEAKIKEAIEACEEELAKIRGLSDEEAISRGLHTRSQLRRGLIKLWGNLDGRWTLRNNWENVDGRRVLRNNGEFIYGYWQYNVDNDKWRWVPKDKTFGERRIRILRRLKAEGRFYSDDELDKRCQQSISAGATAAAERAI